MKQLSRLLLVRPVRSQEHVGTASSYAGIIGDGMPRTPPCPLGLSSDPPLLSQPRGSPSLAEIRETAAPVTVPVGLTRCTLARNGSGLRAVLSLIVPPRPLDSGISTPRIRTSRVCFFSAFSYIPPSLLCPQFCFFSIGYSFRVHSQQRLGC